MAGLVPAIQDFREDVDARHKAGHDEEKLAVLVLQRPED
jgi:hypothetical protein